MQTSFFNTIGFSGVKLKDTEEKCSLQEARILSVMAAGEELTPFEVQVMYEDRFAPIPITSIRRGITNLTDAGKLRKTDKMKKEVYGKPNHKWVKL